MCKIKNTCTGITLTRFSYNKTFNVEGKAVYRFYMRNSGYRNVAHAYAVVFRGGRERAHAQRREDGGSLGHGSAANMRATSHAPKRLSLQQSKGGY